MVDVLYEDKMAVLDVILRLSKSGRGFTSLTPLSRKCQDDWGVSRDNVRRCVTSLQQDDKVIQFIQRSSGKPSAIKPIDRRKCEALVEPWRKEVGKSSEENKQAYRADLKHSKRIIRSRGLAGVLSELAGEGVIKLTSEAGIYTSSAKEHIASGYSDIQKCLEEAESLEKERQAVEEEIVAVTMSPLRDEEALQRLKTKNQALYGIVKAGYAKLDRIEHGLATKVIRLRNSFDELSLRVDNGTPLMGKCKLCPRIVAG